MLHYWHVLFLLLEHLSTDAPVETQTEKRYVFLYHLFLQEQYSICSRHYNYGSPKGYNTQRAYAYEKVYPEQRYSTNHAVSYDRSYNDDDNYPRRGHGSSSSGYRYPGGSGDYSSGGSGYGPSRGGYESRYDSRPAATSGGRDDGKPRMRSYVYKDPYDKSTMRVVEMSSGYPGSSSTLSKTFSKLGGMENFVASLMKNAREAYPY